MKKIVFWIASLFALHAFAQESIYRCGNEYTNDPKGRPEGSCKLVTGGTVQIITDPMKNAAYRNCLTEASKLPTARGVDLAIAVCASKHLK